MTARFVPCLPLLLLPAAALAQEPAVPEAELDEAVQRVRCPRMEYPRMLRQAGIEGRVLLRAVVDTTGRVESGSVEVDSATHGAFEQPAVHMLADCRFRPGRVDGTPVRAEIRMPVNFTLRRTKSGVYGEEELDEPLERVRCPRAPYPRMLAQAGIEGSVTLTAVVGPDGRVESGSIAVVSSTHRAFERPAVAMLEGCEFRPGLVNGEPVRTSVTTSINFTQQGR